MLEVNKSLQRKTGAVLSYINIGLCLVIGIVYTPLMLRLLGQSEYGLYNLSASIISYLSLLGFGLSAGYARFYFRAKAKGGNEDISRLNGMFLTVLSLIGAVSMLAGIIICLHADFVFNYKLNAVELHKARIMLLFLAFNLAISFPAELITAYVTVHECFVFHRLVQIVQSLVKPMVTLPILLLGYASVGMTIVTVIINCLAITTLVVFCIKKLEMTFDFSHFNKGLLVEVCIFSSYIFMNAFTDRANWSVDQYLIGIFNGTVAVAVYAVASQINQIYIMFSTAISSVFMPEVNFIVSTTDDNTELTKLFTKIGRVQFYIVALILIGFVCFGKAFVTLWAGKNYLDAYYITLLLIIPVTVPLIQNLGIEIQKAKNMHKFRSIIYAFMALLNIIISIPLCRAYSGIGAAVGTGVSLTIANGFIMNWYYLKKIKLDIWYFWKNIIKIMPMLVLPIIYGIVANNCFNLYAITSFILTVCGFTIVYAISAWFFGFNDFEKDLLKSAIAKFHKEKCANK